MKHSVAAASLALQITSALAQQLLPVQIRAPTVAHFEAIVGNDTFDFGCRPVAHPTEDGQYKLHALLTRDQINYLANEYREDDSIEIRETKVTKRAASAPIGSGDRFSS